MNNKSSSTQNCLILLALAREITAWAEGSFYMNSLMISGIDASTLLIRMEASIHMAACWPLRLIGSVALSLVPSLCLNLKLNSAKNAYHLVCLEVNFG